MLKYFLKFIILIGLFFCFSGEVYAMNRVSDKISRSWPSYPSNHTISFRTTADIPAGGKILITPETGEFTIPLDFDYTDVDLATSSTEGGIFIDRYLASSSSSFYDGVIASTTFIKIVLNTSYGIKSGTYVKIELGTNASFGVTGDRQIINPIVLDSYELEIETLDVSDRRIKRASVMVAMAYPVMPSSGSAGMRTHGRPVGFLALGTTQTIMSLISNYNSTCRYDTASNTPYVDMPYTFDYTGGTLHTHILTGLTNGDHAFFVRCHGVDIDGDATTRCIYTTATGTPLEITSCVDYVISFSISSYEGEEGGGVDGTGGGEGGGDGTGIGGGGGGGAGGGGSGGGIQGGRGQEIGRGLGKFLPYPPLPDAPGVAFSGWSYPNSSVVVMKDGVEQGSIDSDVNGVFGGFLTDLEQGVYTFGIWSNDSVGRRSSTYSTTFWIDEGTQTVVSGIFLSPTIALQKNFVEPGGTVEVFGSAVPNTTVELWVYSKKLTKLIALDIKKQSVKAGADGSWSTFFNVGDLSSDIYLVKAKGQKDDTGDSDFSQILELSVGAEAESTGGCPGADLNKDGKVNITDFSILLYYWGTDNECADQNNNGNVELIDFSIMMYYWTG